MNNIDANTFYPKLASRQMEDLRQLAVNDFASFIRLIAPYQMLGHCHEDLCKWVQKCDTEYKLLLWPRDHGKSRYAGFYVAWQLVRNPAISIIYASATSSLAEKMLEFIKTHIIESPKFQLYFPNMIAKQEGKRKKWNTSEIIVDHPARAKAGSSDPTILTTGVGGNIIGYHCDLMVLDDIVVSKNTIREGKLGREKVNKWAGDMASILSAENDCLVVGTRYHPKDAYNMMIDADHEVFDEDTGEATETKAMYHVNQADVEVDMQFLWPRAKAKDGKAYGFNKTILAKKKAQYTQAGNITQFYAQYYNDPNDKSSTPIARELFRYYNKEDLYENSGFWYINDQLLTIYAAVDLAATANNTSDYTALTVGGMDQKGIRYLLDARQIKTNKISEIINLVEGAYSKWLFKGLRIEAVGGFAMVANDMKEQLEGKGIRIPIEIYNPGNINKDTRILNILEPSYASQSVFHFRGGDAETLEEQIVSINPPHDDLKDSWAMCIDPTFMKQRKVRKVLRRSNVLKFNSKYGGIDIGHIGKR